jgi:hypothetical protein
MSCAATRTVRQPRTVKHMLLYADPVQHTCLLCYVCTVPVTIRMLAYVLDTCPVHQQ